MNTYTTSAPKTIATPNAMPATARSGLALLQTLRHGSLTLKRPDGCIEHVGDGQGPHVELELHNWRPFAAALKSGDIGFAESYIAGDWSSPHLAPLLQLLLVNRKSLEVVMYGSWLGRLIYRVRHLLHRNTKTNSRKNIHAHYDLGNDFYRLWLDETMNYSSAWFEGNPDQDLHQAQDAKVRRALRMVQIQPGQRILEIGCGWGALAEKAIAEHQAKVTGVTLSTEQLNYAQNRLQRLGLAHEATLRLQDYRDIQDQPFDAICSIEMLEAVGHEYWPTYFNRIAHLLKSGGRACIQSIVIKDALFERYLQSTDFIQQYIFPGGCLPSPNEFKHHAQAAGLNVVDELAFGKDYAQTCRRWRARFMAQKNAVLALGFDERFIRIWEFYLAYCEAGFEAGDIDVIQFTLAKN